MLSQPGNRTISVKCSVLVPEAHSYYSSSIKSIAEASSSSLGLEELSYLASLSSAVTQTITSSASQGCNLSGPLNQTGQTSFLVYHGDDQLYSYSMVTIACSAFLALPKKDQDAATSNAMENSQDLVPMLTAAPGSLNTVSNCQNQQGNSSKILYRPSTGEVLPSGTTLYTADGTETISLACSAWSSFELAVTSISKSLYNKSPQYTRDSLMQSCINGIDGQYTGSIIYTAYSGDIVPSGATSHTATQPELVTRACSGYEKWSSESLLSFQRSPQCTSLAHAIQRNDSSALALPSEVLSKVEWIGRYDALYTCCGQCVFEASTVSVLYWPSSTTGTGCPIVTSKASLPNSELLSELGLDRKRSLTNTSNYAIVDGSTLYVYYACFLFPQLTTSRSVYPSIYLVFQGEISVKDDCGTVGDVHTGLTVPIPSGGLSTFSYSNWPVQEDGVYTNSYDFGACPTWGLSNPFNTTVDGEIVLIQTPGLPYNPVISVPEGVLNFDPAWRSQCSSFVSGGPMPAFSLGVYDPPRPLTPVSVSVASTTMPAVVATQSPPSTAMGPSGLPIETGSLLGPIPAITSLSAGSQPMKSKSVSDSASDSSQRLATPTQDVSTSPMTESSPFLSTADSDILSQSSTDPRVYPSIGPGVSPSIDPSGGPDFSVTDGLQPMSEPSSIANTETQSGLQSQYHTVSPTNQGLGAIIMSLIGNTGTAAITRPTTQTKDVSSLPAASMVVTQITLTSNGQIATETIFSVVNTQASSQYQNAPESILPSAQGSAGTDLIQDSTRGALTSIAPSLLNVGGQTITLNPLAVSHASPGIISNGKASYLGEGAQTSLGASNTFIGLTTVLLGGPDPTAIPIFIAGDQSFGSNPSAISIAGTTLSRNGPGIIIDGTLISLPASGLMFGTSTMPMPPLKPSEMSAIVFDGQTIELNPTAITIDGTTMTPGGPGTTVHGIPLSLAASGLVVGSITIPQMQPVPIVSSAGIASTDLTPISISTMATTTLSPNGAEITVDGVPISLEPSELVIGSETVALGTGSSSLTGTANDHPSSSRMAATTPSKGGVVEMAVPRTWRLLSNMVLCTMLALWASG